MGNLCASCLRAEYARFAEIFFEFPSGRAENLQVQAGDEIVGTPAGADNFVGRCASPTNFSLSSWLVWPADDDKLKLVGHPASESVDSR